MFSASKSEIAIREQMNGTGWDRMVLYLPTLTNEKHILSDVFIQLCLSKTRNISYIEWKRVGSRQEREREKKKRKGERQSVGEKGMLHGS